MTISLLPASQGHPSCVLFSELLLAGRHVLYALRWAVQYSISVRVYWRLRKKKKRKQARQAKMDRSDIKGPKTLF